MWRRAGGELYYRAADKMMAVPFTTSPEFRASAPKQLWEASYFDGAASSCGMPGVSSSGYDVTPDGERDRCSVHSGKPIVRGEKWLWRSTLRQHSLYERPAP